MFLSYGSLAFFCVAIAFVWFWNDSLRTRDVANAAAMAACERIGLQFLDGTVAFSRLRFARVDGRLRLRRTYVFDYTAQSIERRQGFAILLGMEVEYVGFAAEQSARAETTVQSARSDTVIRPQKMEQNAEIIDVPSNVYDLNERRARRLERPDSSSNPPSDPSRPSSGPSSGASSGPSSGPSSGSTSKSDRLH